MTTLSLLKDMKRDESGEPRWMIPRAAAQSPHTDSGRLLELGEKMLSFRATSSKNPWAIRSGLRWSELIGAPTASNGDKQSCGLGQISVVASLLAAGVSTRLQGSNASHDESPPSLRTLGSASAILAHVHQLAADCGSGCRWFESTQLYQQST
jgi:hypothetical protein